MNTTKLEIIAVAEGVSQYTSYALILRDTKVHKQHLSVVISEVEAHAITRLMHKENYKRPLTHTLLNKTIKALDAQVQHIIIDKFEMGIFYAKVVISTAAQEHIKIDSRCSDAVALAIEANVPVLATYEVMDAAAIEMEPIHEDEKVDKDENTNVVHSIDILENEFIEAFEEETGLAANNDLDTLQLMLDFAVEQEDYDTAAILHQEINNQKK